MIGSERQNMKKQRDDNKKKIFDFRLLLRIYTFAKPYAGKFYLSVALAIVLAILSPLRPILINKTLQQVNASTNGADEAMMRFLLTIGLLQGMILLVESVLRFFFSYTTSWLGHRVVKDMRLKVYQKILSLNLRQFDKTPIGTLTTRTVNDMEAINDIFSEGLIPILADLLSIIAILGAMFYTNWQLTLICIIPFPFLMVATYFFKESVNKSFTSVRNAIASLNAFVQEHISGMQVIQAFTAEKREHHRFEEINKHHRDANIQAIFAYSVFFPVVEIILAFSMGLLVWFAARNAYKLNQAEALQVTGNIVSFILLLNLLFRPLRVVADKFNVLQMGMVAGERVLLVLDNKDHLEDQPGAISNKILGNIEFKEVGFYYNEGNPVLQNISFQVGVGETLAIVGQTGSGKSTIINLINRLYQHTEGEILIDGQAISAYAVSSLRRQIGVVLQDVYLFAGSVYENVTLRDPLISKEEVESAAKMIGIHEFILQLPGGYNYDVMERGGTLSMGQRQLLSFMRALLFKPAILILDEATSSVDSHTEKLIQHAIDVLTADRTSIIIAHRLSTIRKANRILVLEKGHIIESGTHEVLVGLGGIYAGLQILQDQQPLS